MTSKRYLQNSASGFSLLEMLVAMTLGLMAVGLTLSATLAGRSMYRLDAVRTRINQDIRGTMDIIGANVRIAGENFNGSFPAIQIIDGVNGTPDALVLRRNLIDEVLKNCVAIVGGSSVATVTFAQGAQAGCVYADNTTNYDAWRAYRFDWGEPVPVYIYNPSSDLGEWLEYTGETDTGTSYSITRASGTWDNDYDTSGTAIYIMEEWKFQVTSDTLQLVQDGNDAIPLNVAFGISDFQVRAILPDGTVLDEFDSSDDWTQLHTIEITLEGEDTYRGKAIQSELVAEFFPRNILSN